jgi:hypothetical protein
MYKFVIIILTMLLIYIHNKKYENFISLDKLVMDLKPKSGITKLDILDSAKDIGKNANIYLASSQADDKILTEFINKQLGKEDSPPPNSYDTKSNMLVYPKPELSEPKKNSKKLDYEDVIEKKSSEIRSKRLNQNLKLRNLRHELKKIINSQKSLDKLREEYVKK